MEMKVFGYIFIVGAIWLFYSVYKGFKSQKLLNSLKGVLAFLVLIAGMALVGASSTSDDSSNKSATSTSKKEVKKPTSHKQSSSSSVSKEVKTVSVDDLVNGINDDTLKNGYYKTDVEFTGQDTWYNKRGHKATNVKTSNGSLLIFATKKQANKLQDGTKATVTLQAKVDNLDGTKVKNLYITDMSVTSGGTSAKAKSEQTHQSLIDDMNAKKNELNKSVQSSLGVDAIVSLDETSDNSYDIELNSAVLDGSDTQVKSTIGSINSQLVDVSSSHDEPTPDMHYYVGTTEVAQNRMIMNPSEVKLEK